MNENLLKVLEAFKSDKAFVAKMEACTSPAEAYEVAKTVAEGFTLEEFQETMTKLYNAAKESGSTELSEEDMQKVAGGLTTEEKIGVAAGVGGGVGLAVAAATAISSLAFAV